MFSVLRMFYIAVGCCYALVFRKWEEHVHELIFAHRIMRGESECVSDIFNARFKIEVCGYRV